MTTTADNYGNTIDKHGIAPTFRWGIGTADEFSVGYYYLDNRQRHQLRHALAARERLGGRSAAANPGGLVDGRSEELLRRRQRLQRRLRRRTARSLHPPLRRRRRAGTRCCASGGYDRDQRASTIRFCVARPRARRRNPDCPAVAPDPGDDQRRDAADTAAPTTRCRTCTRPTCRPTTRTASPGSAGRTRCSAASTWRARSSTTTTWSLPAGVVLNKNDPRTTIGTPNDGTSVDESLRQKVLNRNFVAKALGVYAQDLVEVAPNWKVLGRPALGPLRGRLRRARRPAATAPRSQRALALGFAVEPALRRALAADRPQLLLRLVRHLVQHLGRALQLRRARARTRRPRRAATSSSAPSSTCSRAGCRRAAALFHSTKYNERNRDSPDGQPLERLHPVGRAPRGRRRARPRRPHHAGLGGVRARTPGSRAPRSTRRRRAARLTGEREGDRPSLTPRHSGTIFTTYQLTPALRIGGGLNARSSQTPNRNPPGIVAPSFVTGDLLAEYAFSQQVAFKLNVINVTNKLYADSLYTGHYIPGQPRTVYATMTARF